MATIDVLRLGRLVDVHASESREREVSVGAVAPNLSRSRRGSSARVAMRSDVVRLPEQRYDLGLRHPLLNLRDRLDELRPRLLFARLARVAIRRKRHR